MNRLSMCICTVVTSCTLLLITGCDDSGSGNAEVNQAKEPVPPALQPLIGGPPSAQPMTGPISIMADYRQAANQFGVNLAWGVSQDEAGAKNMFMSPLSVTSAMDMAMMGARGTTLDQFWRVQQYQVLADQPQPLEVAQAQKKLSEELAPAEDAPYQFTNANGVWALNDFKLAPDIEKISAEYFAGGLQELSMPPDQARQHINDWVMSKTNDLIKDLLPAGSITPDSRLVLTNAVYFKGTWTQPFEQRATRDDTFSLADETEIQTPMMRQSQGRFKLLGTETYQAIELPYKGDAISMVVFLPNQAAGLAALQAQLLGQAQLFSEMNKLDARSAEPVDLMLPKFKLSWGTEDLTGPLRSLGLTLPFSPSADFSGFATSPSEKLMISGVYHQAFIEVDELGTEAAAATGIGIRATSIMIDPPATFHANRPFLFLIRHNETGVILFLGRLTDPRSI